MWPEPKDLRPKLSCEEEVCLIPPDHNGVKCTCCQKCLLSLGNSSLHIFLASDCITKLLLTNVFFCNPVSILIPFAPTQVKGGEPSERGKLILQMRWTTELFPELWSPQKTGRDQNSRSKKVIYLRSGALALIKPHLCSPIVGQFTCWHPADANSAPERRSRL